MYWAYKWIWWFNDKKSWDWIQCYNGMFGYVWKLGNNLKNYNFTIVIWYYVIFIWNMVTHGFSGILFSETNYSFKSPNSKDRGRTGTNGVTHVYQPWSTYLLDSPWYTMRFSWRCAGWSPCKNEAITSSKYGLKWYDILVPYSIIIASYSYAGCSIFYRFQD